MKLSSTLVAATTVATLLIGSSTLAFAQVRTAPGRMMHAVNPNAAANRAARLQANATRTALQITHNITSSINMLTVRDTNLNKRMAQQQAKGWPVSTDAQAAISDLEAQIAILKGMIPVAADSTQFKAIRAQHMAVRKAGVADANKANRALLMNHKPKTTTMMHTTQGQQ